MRRRTAGFAIGAVAVVITVGACSHSAGSRSSAAGPAVTHGYPVAAGAGASAARQPAKASDAAAITSTAKIRTAQLTVAVPAGAQVAGKADAAIAVAERAGGEVDADDRSGGKDATATLQLRVPPDALQATLTALSKLGTEQTRQLSTTDVTEKVADVNSRVASAGEAISRLRTLYAKATKVADVIAIEGELSTREADLESEEAQQRALTRQTSMATITLSLVTAPKAAAPATKPKHRGGFVGGLERGWDGFTAAAGWAATALGTVLPFLLLAIVVALAARWAWPRLAQRPVKTAGAGGPPPGAGSAP